MVKTRDPFERPTAQKTKSQVRCGGMKTSPAVSQTGTSAVGQIYHREQLPSKVGCGLKGGPIGNYVPPWLQAKVKLLGLGWLCQCVRVPWTAHEWVRRTEASDRRPLGLCCKMSQLLVGRAVNSEVACYSFQGDFFLLLFFVYVPFHPFSFFILCKAVSGARENGSPGAAANMEGQRRNGQNERRSDLWKATRPLSFRKGTFSHLWAQKKDCSPLPSLQAQLRPCCYRAKQRNTHTHTQCRL